MGGLAPPPIEKNEKTSVTACQANSISTSISISIFEHERRDLAETSPKPCRNSPKPRRNLAETSPKLRRICHFYFARVCKCILGQCIKSLHGRFSGYVRPAFFEQSIKKSGPHDSLRHGVPPHSVFKCVSLRCILENQKEHFGFLPLQKCVYRG